MSVTTCPRTNPDTGQRCNRPLPDDYGYRPCPACKTDIQARIDEANYWKAARLAQALAGGYTIDPETSLLIAPGALEFDGYGAVIASDRAGAPGRRGGDAGGGSRGRGNNPQGATSETRPRRGDTPAARGGRQRGSTPVRRPSNDKLRRRPAAT